MKENDAQMGAPVRLRVWISVLVAAGAAVVAVGVALLLSNTIGLRSSADATIRTDAYLERVVEVERLVVDAETGLRGYVITGRSLFLAPLRAAEARLPQAITALHQSAASDGAFVPQARALAQASRSYLSGYVPFVLGIAAHRLSDVRSFAATLTGKRLVDDVRARTATLERLVTARQDARQTTAHRSADRSVAEAIIVLVVLTVLMVVIGAALGRLAVGQGVARERSERTNRTLQQSLLPQALPTIPGCELAVLFTPAGAGELVGGDFYDAFAVDPGRWAIVVGDVCGKGAEAAAVTAMARWTLRSLAGAPVPPADALRFLNDAMLREDLGGRFITIAYQLLRVVDAGRAEVTVACAGHPAPILVPKAGEPSTLPARGTLLGVWPDILLHTAEIRLSPGDSLVTYTDGVTDQGPETQLSPPLETLRDHAPPASAEQLARLLDRSAHPGASRQRDDIAILALRFTGDLDADASRLGDRELTDQTVLG